MDSVLELGDIAFYWRMRARAEPHPVIPAFLPFAFTFDPAVQLVIQRRDPVVLEWLRRVYLEDVNVGYLQEGHDLSRPYGTAFMAFLDRAAASRPRPVKTIVDVGCGGIYLLKLLKEKGYEVTGIDPSPVTSAQAQKHGIPIIPEFYPPQKSSVRADLMYHHDVLEHVADPVGFLRAHHGHLNEGGCVAIAVPDCTENIRLGDISMLLHEHLNYFDAESLANTVRAAGFRPLAVERSGHGGVLYCLAEPAAEGAPAPASASWEKFERFGARSGRVMQNFRAAVEPFTGGAQPKLGIYVPLRTVPYLSAAKMFSGMRFFDDDVGLHRRYFDGFDIPVENFVDLSASPVSTLLIASLAFGERIGAKVRAKFGDRIELLLWEKVLLA